jgi:predicted nucleic acid-binding protein
LAALTSLATGSAAWALPIFVIGEFLRVVTHPNVFDPPTKEGIAVEALNAALSSRSVRLLVPGDDYWPIFSSLVVRHRVRGNLVHDAQIAAVCLEQGATTVLTEDRDFERFAGISVRRLAGDT